MMISLKERKMDLISIGALTTLALFMMLVKNGAGFMFLLFFIFITILLKYGPKDEKKFLAGVIIAAFVVRVGLMYILHWQSYSQGFQGFISGDDRLYSMKALKIALLWKGEPYNPMFDMGGIDYGINPFAYLLAVFYRFIEHNYFSSKLINCLIGSLTPFFLYLVARKMFSVRVAKLAVILASFYPSIVYWSICNLRDPLVIFLITALLYLALSLKNRRFVPLKICAFIAAFYLLKDLQRICFFAVAGALIFFGIYKTVTIFKRKRMAALFVIILIAIAAMILNISRTQLYKQIKIILANNHSLYISDSARYKIYDASFIKSINSGTFNAAGFAKAYAKGTVYFLFSPFPWQLANARQLAAYPQIVLWYLLIFLSIIGFWRGYKRFPHKTVFMLLFLFIGISSFSIAEANIGAVFRHRDYFSPLVFIYAAVGYLWLFDKDIYNER